MKTLGMIGGMSWESTATYYRLINEGVKRECGGLHSAKIILYSVDFAEIEDLQVKSMWDDAGKIIGHAAVKLEQAGADSLMICTNTMHKVVDQVSGRISIPLLHIADATAEKIIEDGVNCVGLLGTSFTMEQEFYRGRLEKKFGLQVVTPETRDRKIVHDVIFKELCLGRILPESRREYKRIVEELIKKGAEAVILGCTEISLLLRPEDSYLKLYDTTALHAECGVKAIVEM